MVSLMGGHHPVILAEKMNGCRLFVFGWRRSSAPFAAKKTARKPGRDRFSDGLTKSGKAGGRSIL
ncbi:MAG: hypothetical protein C6W56_14495 [Caldibacillus debilis]|nr:MAG: hypothetical protein BAA03_12540 [Caldibacillus debilis]REJ24406.1 MAG: hypothetical protein C6W56_14495 [Caldibacillus debilis]